MRNRVNFGVSIDFEWTPTFLCLPDALEVGTAGFPLTLERLQGCLYFAAKLNNADATGDRAKRIAARYFRAALSEFGSVADIFKKELNDQNRASDFDFLSTQDPFIHTLRLLRHLQVHLISSTLSEETMSLHLKKVPDAVPVECSKWLIDDIGADQFRQLDAFRRRRPLYLPEVADQMSEFVRQAQSKFGIADFIWRGVVASAEIVNEQS